jgi:type VI secretion system protein VasJ
MRWRLSIAQVMLVVKKSQMALPHVDQAMADIDTHRLEQWDPLLAAEGLTMAWKAYSAQAVDAHKLKAAEILGRIARIDPGRALQLQK